MNPIMTNTEFHEAWSNLSFHHTPDGYWNKINEQRKNHRYVGRKIMFRGRLVECVRAEDNLAIFKIDDDGGELIISGNDVWDIKWIK